MTVRDAEDEGPGARSRSESSVATWLLEDTIDERYIDRIFVQMCERLVFEDCAISRATLFFDTHNPQWLGARILWEEGVESADIRNIDYGIEEHPDYIASPMYDVSNGASEVRCRLGDALARDAPSYPIYDELKEAGFTDYVAWPLRHTMGRRHAVTFASKRPGGFRDADVATLRRLLPILSLVSEIRLKNVLARTLLETYVGPHASEEILAGATTRGSGVTVEAAIVISDLRDFTSISDLWPRDDVIGMLNAYFDAIVEPVSRHGGEILKFMGDGLLAIFKLSDPSAATRLLRAVGKAQTNIDEMNADNERRGRPRLGYGIGVHSGDVMYGNIGSKSRLDFTAIGPAVNVASRLENLTKILGRPILLSKAFAEMAHCTGSLEALGRFPLRGLGDPLEVFAFAGNCALLADEQAR